MLTVIWFTEKIDHVISFFVMVPYFANRRVKTAFGLASCLQEHLVNVECMQTLRQSWCHTVEFMTPSGLRTVPSKLVVRALSLSSYVVAAASISYDLVCFDLRLPVPEVMWWAKDKPKTINFWRTWLRARNRLRGLDKSVATGATASNAERGTVELEQLLQLPSRVDDLSCIAKVILFK